MRNLISSHPGLALGSSSPALGVSGRDVKVQRDKLGCASVPDFVILTPLYQNQTRGAQGEFFSINHCITFPRDNEKPLVRAFMIVVFPAFFLTRGDYHCGRFRMFIAGDNGEAIAKS